MIKLVVCAAVKDLAGWSVRVVTLTGRTLHGTGYYPTEKAANEAAWEWIEGYRETEKAANGPTPLG